MEKSSAILELYEQVEMYKDSTPKYKKLLKDFNDTREEFDKQLNDEQKKKLEEIFNLLTIADGQEMEEYFVERLYTWYKANDRSIM